MGRARSWHAVTAAVAITAITLQLVLVFQGGRVLDESGTDVALELRLGRFVSYFTVQSNILVAITTVMLALDPLRDGQVWRVLRVAGLVGITVTGVVHFVLLRPLLDLDGADYVADKLLHMAVPLLAVVGWAVFGPRPRIRRRDNLRALCWPILWVAYTLVVGGITGWYPYPFLDHREPEGVAGVVVTCLGITVFFLILFRSARLVDERAAPVPIDPVEGGRPDVATPA